MVNRLCLCCRSPESDGTRGGSGPPGPGQRSGAPALASLSADQSRLVRRSAGSRVGRLSPPVLCRLGDRRRIGRGGRLRSQKWRPFVPPSRPAGAAPAAGGRREDCHCSPVPVNCGGGGAAGLSSAAALVRGLRPVSVVVQTLCRSQRMSEQADRRGTGL